MKSPTPIIFLLLTIYYIDLSQSSSIDSNQCYCVNSHKCDSKGFIIRGSFTYFDPRPKLGPHCNNIRNAKCCRLRPGDKFPEIPDKNEICDSANTDNNYEDSCYCVDKEDCDEYGVIYEDCALKLDQMMRGPCKDKNQACCRLANDTITPSTTQITPLDDCFCVPYFKCDRKGYVIPGSYSIFDPRPMRGPICETKHERCCKFNFDIIINGDDDNMTSTTETPTTPDPITMTTDDNSIKTTSWKPSPSPWTSTTPFPPNQDCYCVPEYKCDRDFYILIYTFCIYDPIPLKGVQNCRTDRNEVCCKLRPGDAFPQLLDVDRPSVIDYPVEKPNLDERKCYCVRYYNCDDHGYIVKNKNVTIFGDGLLFGQSPGSRCDDSRDICCLEPATN